MTGQTIPEKIALVAEALLAVRDRLSALKRDVSVKDWTDFTDSTLGDVILGADVNGEHKTLIKTAQRELLDDTKKLSDLDISPERIAAYIPLIEKLEKKEMLSVEERKKLVTFEDDMGKTRSALFYLSAVKFKPVVKDSFIEAMHAADDVLKATVEKVNFQLAQVNLTPSTKITEMSPAERGTENSTPSGRADS